MRAVFGERYYLDTTPGATLISARRALPIAEAGRPGLLILTATGQHDDLDGPLADVVWQTITEGATRINVPETPLPGPPDPPPPIPDLDPPGSANGFPTTASPAVGLSRGPGIGNAVVLMLLNRAEVGPYLWAPSPGGDDVYMLAMDPKREWFATIGGGSTNDSTLDRPLNVDDRGYGWLYVEPTPWATIRVWSRERPKPNTLP